MGRVLQLLAAAMVMVFLLAGVAGSALAAEHEQIVYMAAIEPKGSTNIENEPFPEEALPEGGGYALDAPDEDGNWVVETYMWLPSDIVVMQGDDVNLQVLGVNGALHPTTIEGYDISFDVTRGNLTEVQFTADQAGVFSIICAVHQPTMTGRLIVLPTEA